MNLFQHLHIYLRQKLYNHKLINANQHVKYILHAIMKTHSSTFLVSLWNDFLGPSEWREREGKHDLAVTGSTRPSSAPLAVLRGKWTAVESERRK